MLSLSRVVPLVLVVSVTAAGQATTSNWDSVKIIVPGTEVRVAAGNAKTVRGKLESVSDSSLVVTSASATESLQRPEIHSVAVRKSGHRLRNMLISMGVGTGAGAGIGAAQASGCKDFLCDLAVPVFAVLGFIAGTVTGLVWPTGGWRQIYAQ